MTTMAANKSISYDGKTITIHGVTYSRGEFRTALERVGKKQQSDPKSAYRDPNHPQHEAVKAELTMGYKWLHGELTPADERAVVESWINSDEGNTDMANEQRPEL